MCTINNNHMMYGSSDMDRDKQHFLSFWTVFCSPTPWTQKIKIFKKGKEHLKTIIILQMYTINDSHMMYSCWDMECNGQSFLSFWTNFCPFTLKQSEKPKFWKNHWRYYHFQHVYHKWQSYDIWFLRYEAWRTEAFVILDHFLILTS